MEFSPVRQGKLPSLYLPPQHTAETLKNDRISPLYPSHGNIGILGARTPHLDDKSKYSILGIERNICLVRSILSSFLLLSFPSCLPRPSIFHREA